MKKFFSAILLMTMMVFSVGTFVSCNDLVNEIEDVKGQAGELQTAIAELEGEIASLETALQNAKAEAADAAAKAKAAADEAQKTGDEALKAAQDAAAAAAAAQASADAIEETLAAAKTALQAALDGKADKADVEAAVKDIEALKAALEGKADKTDVDALKAELDLLKKTLEGYKDLLAQLEILTPDLDERINYNLEAVTNAQGTADANAEEIAALKDQINDLNVNLTGYTTAVKDLADRIQSIVYVPENADGTMEANQYYLGSGDDMFASDVLIKATYEITPAKYAEQIKHVYFNTVPVTKAYDAEVVKAEVVEAKDGRITVYGRVKNNAANQLAYTILTDPAYAAAYTVSLALNVVNSKEDIMLPDSSKVNTGTHVSSAYVPVVANAATNIENIIGIYSTTQYIPYTYHNLPFVAGAADKTISYKDNNTYKLLEDYAVLAYVEGQYMTLEQAGKFLNTTLEVEYDVDVVHYGKTAPLDADDPNEVFPIVDAKDGFATSLKNTKSSDAYFDYHSTVSLSDFVLNEDYELTSLAADATLTLSYETAAVTIETFDAGNWSYAYYLNAKGGNLDLFTATTAAQRYHYYDFDLNNSLPKERAVTANVDITTLTCDGLGSDGVITLDVTAPYTKADNTPGKKNGKIKIDVLSSKAVALLDAELEYHDTPLTYTASFKMYDDKKVEYTVEFKINLGARPADKTIKLNGGNTIEIDGYTSLHMSNGVTPMAEVLAVDSKFYEDIMEVKADYSNVNDVKFYNFEPATQTGALQFDTKLYKWDNDSKKFNETATIELDKAAKYDAKYDIKETYELFGVKYEFVGTVQLKKPAFTITRERSLVNADNEAEVVGTVGFPDYTKKTPREMVSTPFTLNKIDLRKYIYVNDATAKAIDEGELELVYSLQKTAKDKDGKAVYPSDKIGVTAAYKTDYKVDKTLTDKSKSSVILKWDDKEVSEIEYHVTLQSVAEVDDKKVVFATVPVKLWIDDYVVMSVKAKAPEFTFVTGKDVNSINVVTGIEIKGTDKNLYPTYNTWGYLYNPVAVDLSEIWASNTYKASLTGSVTEYDKNGDFVNETAYQVYGQNLKIDPDKKATAEYVSGGTYTNNWGVDRTTGKVTLFDHDSPLIEDVVVTVPVVLTHWYGEAQTENVKVYFRAE